MNIHIQIATDQVTLTFDDHTITIDLEGPTTPVVGTDPVGSILAYDEERRIQRRIDRDHRDAQIALNYEAYISVPCSYCRVDGGQHCVTAEGRQTRPHAVRLHLVDELDGAPPTRVSADVLATAVASQFFGPVAVSLDEM